MGLGAGVRCACWEAGKVSEPPVPRERLYVDETDQLAIDPDCYSEEDEEKLWEWMGSACEHPGMCYASEYVASYHFCQAFEAALREAGEERFGAVIQAMNENS